MIKAIIFGGTTEGRKLCEFCVSNNIKILYCVATEDGARPVESLNVNIRIGRLPTEEIAVLLKQYAPMAVIDATHPYAQEISKNIAAACQRKSIRLVRVTRERAAKEDCLSFCNVDDLISWLEKEPGNIFIATGSKAAAAFTKLTDFQSRSWIRVLPNLDSLGICLNLGYRPEHIICMQGPFSEEINRAMFKNANARILVTKDSGAEGGFSEKIRAAQSLSMVTAVIAKPQELSKTSLEDVYKTLMELIT